MRKERFPKQRKSKLQPRADEPFQVLEKINENAYKIDLPSKYNLSPFITDDEALDLTSSPSQEEWNDAYIQGLSQEGGNDSDIQGLSQEGGNDMDIQAQGRLIFWRPNC